MNFTDFYAKWGTGGTASSLNERQGAQPHFMDLCALLGVPTPDSSDNYLFEQNTLLLGEARGFADVFKRGCFAWENKKPGSNLDTALNQLLRYSLALSNPPLLIVCDRLTIRIHTQFTGHPSVVHTITIQELEKPEKQALLRRVWIEPESFRPKDTTRDITEDAAKSFATLAERLRNRGLVVDKNGIPTGAGTAVNKPEAVAHFLNQCLFCFFFDDVELLPRRLFENLVNKKNLTPDKLTAALTNLFTTMKDGGLYGSEDIYYFNGGLFETIHVPQLDILDVSELRKAAEKNWIAIDASIFGTLFERGLDPRKRSQLGAHYTDPATIERIIDPIIRRPLLQKWEHSKQEIRRLLAKSKLKKRGEYKINGRRYPASAGDASYQKAEREFANWLAYLKNFRILDPACGSGNFLYLGLKTLKDIEALSHQEVEDLGLDRQTDLVTGPHNMLGIELNEYAAELARVTVWIGELQWRRSNGYELKNNPVLEPLDCIEHRDALLAWQPDGTAIEAEWPKTSVVVGNPPFLGGSKKRRELGDINFEALDKVYKGRVPGGADLVCYWFDKALKAIENNGLGAAGFVATQAIRAGSNRQVLDAIVSKSRIFDAWADETWVNDGAAVRVSKVCFGAPTLEVRLNGQPVISINADLKPGGTGANDLTQAMLVRDNKNTVFLGTKKSGGFDIAGSLAREWLIRPNPNGRSNSEVLFPWANGQELVGRPLDKWIIDFGTDRDEESSSLFEAPFNFVVEHIKPTRETNNRAVRAKYWWRLAETMPAMRKALGQIPRYVATPRVAKHRIFTWRSACFLPDDRLAIIARADDTTFGILSSRIHEVWSLAQASIHGDGDEGGRPTYNAKSCFETFPFPAGLTPQDTAHQQTRRLESGAVLPDGAQNGSAEAIAQAAFTLNQRRDNWLNPLEWTQKIPEIVPLGMSASPYPDRIVAKAGHEKELSDRTLTKLYNARPAWLNSAHAALDAAVATAYGWADYTAEMADEVILQRLLALNVERSVERSGK